MKSRNDLYEMNLLSESRLIRKKVPEMKYAQNKNKSRIA